MTFQKSVDSILDTPYVEGLVVFDLDGMVHFQQTPKDTDVAMLEKLPQRILLMYEIIADNFQNCSDFILKFEQKNLYFRKSNKGKGKSKEFVLAIIGGAGVNFVSLKLVTNIAIKMMEFDEQSQTAQTVKKKSRSELTYRGQKY